MIRKKTNWKQDIFIWFIAISCILLQYQTAVMTYGLIALLVVCIWRSLKKGFLFDKEFLVLVFIISLQQFISCLVFKFDFLSSIGSVINIFLIAFICSSAVSVKDKEQLYKCCACVGIVCTVAIFIQFFIINVLGQNVSAIMLFSQGEELKVNWFQNYYRPSGFFSEAQTHCTFMIPIVLASIENKKYKFAIFLSLGACLTGSSLGIVIISLIWLLLLFSTEMGVNKKIMMLTLIAIGITAFMVLEPFDWIRDKLFTVFTDFSAYTNAKMINNYSYSNYLRLIKGWATFIEFPFMEKIFGIGIANFTTYLKYSNVEFSWNILWANDARMAAYFTSAAGVFIECGIIVGIIYYIFLYRKIEQGSKLSKKIILFLLIQSFTTQTFFNSIFIFYFLLYYAFQDTQNRMIRFKFGG